MPVGRVTFFSKRAAEELIGSHDIGMISITSPDPHGSPANLNPDDWGAFIAFEFFDLDHPWQNYTLFDEYMARQLASWVKANEHHLGEIYVHCEQGVSRSAAVAMAIGEYLGLELDEADLRFHNRLVYRLLREALTPD